MGDINKQIEAMWEKILENVRGLQTENTRLREENTRLREGLRKYGYRKHTYCEETWYSCPKEETEGCADESQGTECNCGADGQNAAIDAILKEGSGCPASPEEEEELDAGPREVGI